MDTSFTPSPFPSSPGQPLQLAGLCPTEIFASQADTGEKGQVSSCQEEVQEGVQATGCGVGRGWREKNGLHRLACVPVCGLGAPPLPPQELQLRKYIVTWCSWNPD